MHCTNRKLTLRLGLTSLACLLFAAGCGRTALGIRNDAGTDRQSGSAPDASSATDGQAPETGASPVDARRDLAIARADAAPDRNAADLPKTASDAAVDKAVDAPEKWRTDTLEAGRRDTALRDAALDRPSEGGAEAGRGTLSLLAGATGGRGDGDGIGKAARFNAQEGLVADGKGNLYVADHNNHTIRRIVLATAEVTTIAGTPGVSGLDDGLGSQARFDLPTTLTYDGAGRLFVVDQNARAIRKIALDTGRVDTLVAFSNQDRVADAGATWGPIRHMRGIASDGQGNLFVADYSGCTVRKIVVATGEISILAGAPDQRAMGDGIGLDARFSSPFALAIDKRGNLFVSDSWSLRKIVIASGEVTTLAKAANAIVGIAPHDNGEVFIADSGSYLVRKFDPSSGTLSTLFAQAADPVNDGQDAEQATPFMNALTGDGAGNLYISEHYDHRIRKIEIATGRGTPLAGDMQRRGTVDGIGDTARFAHVNGLASDGAGHLFVADGAGTIRRIEPDTRTVSTFAGVASARGGRDGVGTAASFFTPHGLTNDGLGNLFATDRNDREVRRIVLSSADVTTLAGTPTLRQAKDGVGTAAGFREPLGLASDTAGNLFVVDSSEHTIRKIVIATGEVTTFAGKTGSSGHEDGAGADARFSAPQAIVSDGAGNLFVSDGGNATIRKIVIKTGQVSTLAGAARSTGYADGVGIAARFSLPKGLAYDGAGILYVADSANHLVRRIEVATATVTTVVGTPGRAAVALGSLPGGLSWPEALALMPSGDLVISSLEEAVVLVARFH